VKGMFSPALEEKSGKLQGPCKTVDPFRYF
jgi:hypothetical protein